MHCSFDSLLYFLKCYINSFLVKWIHQVKKENDTTRSKMAQIQDALRQKKNRRKSRLNGEPTQRLVNIESYS